MKQIVDPDSRPQLSRFLTTDFPRNLTILRSHGIPRCMRYLTDSPRYPTELSSRYPTVYQLIPQWYPDVSQAIPPISHGIPPTSHGIPPTSHGISHGVSRYPTDLWHLSHRTRARIPGIQSRTPPLSPRPLALKKTSLLGNQFAAHVAREPLFYQVSC